MKRLGTPLLSLAIILAIVGSAVAGPIVQQTTTANITGSGGRNIFVGINSSIWNYADYMTANPGTSIAAGTYIYEYVLQNSQNSNVSITMFQVPITGPTGINAIATVNNNGGVGAMSIIVDQMSLPSATYLFLTPALAPCMGSVRLIYSSDATWTTTTATIAGGSITADLSREWTPVPEPVTALLFGFGGLALIRKRKAC